MTAPILGRNGKISCNGQEVEWTDIEINKGNIKALPEGMTINQLRPICPLVHIHDDLYVDAARVVSVLGAVGVDDVAYLRVVYMEGNTLPASTIFAMPDRATAQRLAHEIQQRVNEGRRLLTDPTCADCGDPIGEDDGPSDGWQMEDGRTICHSCAAEDTRKVTQAIVELAAERNNEGHNYSSAYMMARNLRVAKLVRREEAIDPICDDPKSHYASLSHDTARAVIRRHVAAEANVAKCYSCLAESGHRNDCPVRENIAGLLHHFPNICAEEGLRLPASKIATKTINGDTRPLFETHERDGEFTARPVLRSSVAQASVVQALQAELIAIQAELMDSRIDDTIPACTCTPAGLLNHGCECGAIKKSTENL